MNQLAHIFITYIIFSLILPNAKEYLLPIILFSIILDIDHIPGYVKILFSSKNKRNSLTTKDLVNLFRTQIQEPIGIITIEAILLLLYVFGVKSVILLIAALAILIHWLIDFLTVHTRPLSPINNKIISIFFHTKKARMVSEILITLISGIIFLILLL